MFTWYGNDCLFVDLLVGYGDVLGCFVCNVFLRALLLLLLLLVLVIGFSFCLFRLFGGFGLLLGWFVCFVILLISFSVCVCCLDIGFVVGWFGLGLFC